MVNGKLYSEENVLLTMQLDEAADAASLVCDDAYDLKLLARSVLAEQKRTVKNAELLESEAEREKVEHTLDSFYRSGLLRIRSIYDAIIQPNAAGGLLNTSKVECDNFDNFSGEAEGIYSFVSDGKLYIKLPLLPPIVNVRGNSYRVKRARELNERSRFFERNLRVSLQKLGDEIPTFVEQTIMFVTAYDGKKTFIPDCDNLDAKRVTDVICLHTCCDDSARKTSFFLTGIESDSEQIGTYICVSPTRFSVQNPKEIVSKIQTANPYKKPAHHISKKCK